MVSTPKNRKMGLIWLFGPWYVYLIVMILWGIFSFIFSTIGGSSLASAVNIILGFVGMVSVVLGLVGIPVGFVYLLKRTPESASNFDPRSGKGAASVVPEELKGWNWGAAGLSFMWAFYHHVWWCFIGLIPMVNMVWWIVMGIYGSEWAWKAMPQTSLEDFLATQKKWKPWGIAMFIVTGLVVLAYVAIAMLSLVAMSSLDGLN